MGVIFIFILTTCLGIKGIVADENGTGIEGAKVYVRGRDRHPVCTTDRGEYWRLLLPGTYVLTVSSHCDYVGLLHGYYVGYFIILLVIT